MANLADYIEEHLRRLLDQAREGAIEIQRRELADLFNCVPSQINYVISTRFTADRGFLVESRRGEGGYIRIFRVKLDTKARWLAMIEDSVGDLVTAQEANNLLLRLCDAGIISEQEQVLVKTVMMRYCDSLKPRDADVIRSRVLKASLTVLLAAKDS